MAEPVSAGTVDCPAEFIQFLPMLACIQFRAEDDRLGIAPNASIARFPGLCEMHRRIRRLAVVEHWLGTSKGHLELVGQLHDKRGKYR
jgi:hypothetical protein